MLEFNSEVQQMKCPYCDSEFSIEAMQEHDAALDAAEGDKLEWETSQDTWSEEEAAGMKVYKCQSCGGEIVADETTGASKCPYCDNPVVMTGQFSGDLKPEFIIPFKYDKEAAKKALTAHFQGKKLLPSVFKDQHKIDEIKGVYVPVWLFDANATASISYKAKKVKRWSDNDYDYVKSDFFMVKRAGKIAFEQVPVDGSTKMDDKLMESIEPFDFKGAVPFQPAYMAGYLADKYDVGAEESIQRANDRVRHSVEQAFRETVTGYEGVETEHTSIQLDNAKAKYAMYPVWLLNISWNGQNYPFAMNGQTGKFVGDLPADKGQAIKKFFLIAIILTIIFSAIGFALGLG
jgi:DNA-directed RNA polymerase subunit RPC12/RpoP